MPTQFRTSYGHRKRGIKNLLMMSSSGEHNERTPVRRKFRQSVSLLAWGYNEQELIVNFLDRAVALLDATVEDFEIVLIDDGSTDDTGRLADNYAARESRVRCLHNGTNRGVGYSCRRAISEARRTFLLWQTIDWSYDLSDLRIFLELLNHFDVVQGVRAFPTGLLSRVPVLCSILRIRSRSDSFAKAVISLCNYYLIRILFGASFNDFQNVTFYKSEFIQNVELVGNSSFANPECLLKALSAGLKIIEVPIGFIRRKTGVAKGTRFRSIVRSIRDILTGWLDWGWRMRLRNPFRLMRQVYRISEPERLAPEVMTLVGPLLEWHHRKPKSPVYRDRGR